MNVSPQDVRQQRFRVTFRGFDQVDVTSFLAAVADDYEQALREADRLRQDLTKMEAILNEHREHEKNLRNTLMTAQKLSEEIRKHAEQEAQRIIRKAESRSDSLLEKTYMRLEDVQRDLDGLTLKRREVETSIEAAIRTLHDTLEYVRERDEHDGNGRTIRPRGAADSPDGDTPDRHGNP